jgi:light-regulated signal transduction histidine kinase (bacteriophytochrome)
VTAFAEGASTFQAELSVTTLTGDRRRVMMNVSLLRAASPDWSEVVVTFTDISERRRLEQSLKNAYESLRRLNQHLEQFAYAAAHDMREPLRTIALYAQMLQRHHPPEAGTNAETALRYIRDSAGRMDTLMDDLLAFARVGDPLSAADGAVQTDAHVVLADVLLSLTTAVQQSAAQIHIDADLPSTCIRAVHLRQLFQNLISNAIKYCGNDANPVVRINGETSSGEVKFCVADEGIGIGAEYHQKIFGIFKRLHGFEIEGNGIGLALCKKIVEDYGGRIWVESAPGEGSRFYFAVPHTFGSD